VNADRLSPIPTGFSIPFHILAQNSVGSNVYNMFVINHLVAAYSGVLRAGVLGAGVLRAGVLRAGNETNESIRVLC
jgi:hypothetical protein